MTDETRETLTSELGTVEKAVMSYPLAVANARLAAALRDVLTPRTCSVCTHVVPVTRWNGLGEFLICGCSTAPANGRQVAEDDGCIKGWQAREGEGGTR